MVVHGPLEPYTAPAHAGGPGRCVTPVSGAAGCRLMHHFGKTGTAVSSTGPRVWQALCGPLEVTVTFPLANAESEGWRSSATRLRRHGHWTGTEDPVIWPQTAYSPITMRKDR